MPQTPATIMAEPASWAMPKGSPRMRTPAATEITVVRFEKTMDCETLSRDRVKLMKKKARTEDRAPS